ncbi:MAG: SDR family NAD(P)-dependent oxidoreductase [Alphaproteobacteria bacterium]|nr:SDR family NAD(P)-dependent oxidoreductase [Alphaproteobacteria bacterium]
MKKSKNNHLFIFGLGYVGQHLARALHQKGWQITGTTRHPKRLEPNVPNDWQILKFEDGGQINDLSSHLSNASHVITTISALAGYDPVLKAHQQELCTFSGWVGYVSAPSVYPDQEQGFIDESVPAAPATKRGLARLIAEQEWQGACRAEIFRVAGIYGPGRNPIINLLEGSARIIEREGQLTNRINQTDITNIIIAAMAKPRPSRIINLCDEEPASQGEVVRYAASLLGIEPPKPIAFEDAELTPMARSFYISKRRLRSVVVGPELGVKLIFPTYREGLKALVESKGYAPIL